jgi:tRNA-dihydrouridine synthase
MLKIGNAELKHGIMLAPMAGATDHAFRSVCRSFGAEYLVS